MPMTRNNLCITDSDCPKEGQINEKRGQSRGTAKSKRINKYRSTPAGGASYSRETCLGDRSKIPCIADSPVRGVADSPKK